MKIMRSILKCEMHLAGQAIDRKLNGNNPRDHDPLGIY